VLERPPSLSPDRLVYQPMEPSDANASPQGCRSCLCTIHGYANGLWLIFFIGSRGGGGGWKRIIVWDPTGTDDPAMAVDSPYGEEDDQHTRKVAWNPSAQIHYPASLGRLPCGHVHSAATPTEWSQPSRHRSPSALMSPASHVLQRLAHLASPSRLGHALGSWRSTARPWEMWGAVKMGVTLS
jgi:hypothetical protein